MQSTPKGVNILKISKEIQQIEKVRDIHHVHVWSLSDKETHFEAHINLAQDLKTSECEQIIKNIEHLLHEHHKINHVTLQMEYEFCDEKTIISNNH
jgi:cobalt-zinc-cadmium efflux system protein